MKLIVLALALLLAVVMFAPAVAHVRADVYLPAVFYARTKCEATADRETGLIVCIEPTATPPLFTPSATPPIPLPYPGRATPTPPIPGG